MNQFYIKKKYNVLVILGALLVLQSGCARLFHAKSRKAQSVASVDTSKKSNTTKKYHDLLKGAVSTEGFITVHKVKTDYYFEIPLKVMDKDLLVVNKISSVPFVINDAGVNKGMNYENKMIRLYLNKEAGTVWVKTYQPQVESPGGDAITRSVNKNFGSSVIEFFKVDAYSADSSSVVVKVNKVFDGTEQSLNDVFSNIGLGTSPKTALSAIESMKAYPKNVVVHSLLSTKVTEGKESVPVSVSVSTNILLLPEKPMVPRFADSRVGFFTTPRWYFSDEQHQMESRELVTRWRLQPKAQDVAAYKRGELVEPEHQIVYYIDPSTPKKWRKYIIDGVYDWQKAFEAAGFKNAIVAKEVKDSVNFDPDDVQNSVISYAASAKANAMGPSVYDPRSGEILEADVIWWHNVMTAVQTWMRVQTGIIDPKARPNRMSDEQMGEAIRFVSSHEIGHTLGLKHNMGASFSFPVDSLRSPSFTKRMGGTAPSIMDYARFNYVAQPEDHVQDITPKIGVYDKYAIAWAYRWLDVKDPHEELPLLGAWIKEKENDPRYKYGEQQDFNNIVDPRSQSEDLGNNAMLASSYGLKNLKRMVPQIINWSTQSGENYYNAGKLYMAVLGQWQSYADHVTANVGGIYLENPVMGDKKDAYAPVPVNLQVQALDYIKKEVFKMPDWLFNDAALLRKTFAIKDSPMGAFEYAPYNIRRNYQYSVLYSLLSDERLMRMLEMEMLFGKDKVLTVPALVGFVTRNAFEPTVAGRSLTVADRMLQQNYVDALLVSTDKIMEKVTKRTLAQLDAIRKSGMELACAEVNNRKELRNIYTTAMTRTSDVAVYKRGELLKILDLITKYKNTGDQVTRSHYLDLQLRIRQSLGIK